MTQSSITAAKQALASASVSDGSALPAIIFVMLIFALMLAPMASSRR